MTAPPDIRLLMDNQFRNVKTHARLLSKATWYEWRMKLLEGLKDGLNRHVEEMNADGEFLAKHESLLDGVVPALVEKHSSLEQEATNLQQLADEMENCDQDELRSAREKLAGVDEEIAAKKRQLQELQGEVKGKTDTIETGTELKAEFLAQIQEAERVKEECRGWSAKEINELKGRFPQPHPDYSRRSNANFPRLCGQDKAPDWLVNCFSDPLGLWCRSTGDDVVSQPAATQLQPDEFPH